MRVNLISNHRKNTGLSKDVDIMRGILTAVFDKGVDICPVQYSQPHCREADFNIFFEVVNPCLFPYAKKNIWIPNHERTLKTWTPYLKMVDEIWVKTREAQDIFKDLENVRYIGWTSINKEFPLKKNYYKGIVPIGKNSNRELDIILDAYQKIRNTDSSVYRKLPVLNIVSWIPIEVPEQLKDSIIVHKLLSDNDYDELLKECGVCICLSKAEGFGHAVNEAMASGCHIIASSIGAFKEDIVGSSNLEIGLVEPYDTIENTQCFGTFVKSDMNSLIEKLEEYIDMPFKTKKSESEFIRKLYETNHKQWMERIRTILLETFVVETPYSLKDGMPKEDDLPNVSIVCITRDRRVFMPILKYSYMIQSYPEEKLELIIVDDGDDSIEDTLIGIPNVVYVRLDEKKTIGEKRNIGISKAMYDVIMFMDDDDVYPNNSVLERAAMLLKSPKKECAFSTMIPCYDITKYSSFMNAPPIQLEMSQRVSEATLVFTKSFWEEKKFPDIQIAEGDAFIRGREHMCRELSPQEIIVSLVHPKNTSSRKIPDFKEPNGCHFGFNEKLFAMVSEIGESLKAK
jgi:glycosyltransferase involved in cell wall biosynthesis